MANAEDDELTRLAMEELTKSAQRGKERTETLGATGWTKKDRSRTNKLYLRNALLGAVQSNKRIERASSSKCNASVKYIGSRSPSVSNPRKIHRKLTSRDDKVTKSTVAVVSDDKEDEDDNEPQRKRHKKSVDLHTS